MTLPPIRSERLELRELTVEDAPFILELLNDPDWLRYIGDRGVRTLDDAIGYIDKGPRKSYLEHRHGLFAVELLETAATIGLCGILKRETLELPDLGFAFLPLARGRGYAIEAARAALADAERRLGIGKIAAITSLDNRASIRLLEACGFRFEKIMEMNGEVRYFVRDLTKL